MAKRKDAARREELARENRRFPAGELTRAVEDCIRHCLETGEPPVDYVLHGFTRAGEEDMQRFIRAGETAKRGDRIRERYLAARRWEEFKTYYWLRLAQEDPKSANFAMFNLKQYGSDRETGSTVVVRLAGVGGEEGMR